MTSGWSFILQQLRLTITKFKTITLNNFYVRTWVSHRLLSRRIPPTKIPDKVRPVSTLMLSTPLSILRRPHWKKETTLRTVLPFIRREAFPCTPSPARHYLHFPKAHTTSLKLNIPTIARVYRRRSVQYAKQLRSNHVRTEVLFGLF